MSLMTSTEHETAGSRQVSSISEMHCKPPVSQGYNGWQCRKKNAKVHYWKLLQSFYRQIQASQNPNHFFMS